MKRFMKSLIIVLAVTVVALPVQAVAPQGELDMGLGFGWNSDEKKVEHSSTLTGFRIVLEDDVDLTGKVHFSFKGWRDWKTKEGKLGVDQFWFGGYAGDVDYTLGRQVISWGTADGFNPTNYFGRMDTNALFSGDLTSEPTWAGQASYYGSNWSVTGVVAPYFQAQKIDDAMQDMMPEFGVPEGLDPALIPIVESLLPPPEEILDAIKSTPKPKSFGKNTQWALRAETQLAGFDVQASYFSGFEPLPGLEVLLGPGMIPDISFEGQYRRQHFVGLATSGTIGKAGVWGELAYGGPQSFEKPDDPDVTRVPLSMNEKYLQAVIGGDYTFDLGKGLLVQGQYIYRGQGSLFMPYVMPEVRIEGFSFEIAPGEVKPAHYLYSRLGYDFSQDSSVDVVLLHGFDEEGGLIRPAYTYRFPNAMQLELSMVKTYGKEEGVLASIPLTGRLAVSYKF